ncbi:DivIVA domain-containing protein [Babesia caballi]|uniref:DivIVA domain-containing protein n=1 Tax=Babesia caballi TaxID=5871 RepID=A0AAV4LZ55_BABCB|nr:DivIVA domain-containing protein [Babesia caballi]
MPLERVAEIASLQKTFKNLTSKGAFSTVYVLPLTSVFGVSDCVLHIRVPRSYPERPVEITAVNPIPHPWIESNGFVRYPDWLKDLPLVYVVEAVITQFRDYHEPSDVTLIPSYQAVQAPSRRARQEYEEQLGERTVTSQVRADSPPPSSVPSPPVESDEPKVPSDSLPQSAELVQKTREVDAMVLKACQNPPTAAFPVLVDADRDEVLNMLSNEDMRWKVLYASPELAELTSSLHELLKTNEATSLEILATVNKKQDRLQAIDQKLKTLEDMNLKPEDARKMQEQYRELHREQNQRLIAQLRQQIDDKTTAMQGGDARFEDCYDELLALHRRCNELATIQLALFS